MRRWICCRSGTQDSARRDASPSHSVSGPPLEGPRLCGPLGYEPRFIQFASHPRSSRAPTGDGFGQSFSHHVPDCVHRGSATCSRGSRNACPPPRRMDEVCSLDGRSLCFDARPHSSFLCTGHESARVASIVGFVLETYGGFLCWWTFLAEKLLGHPTPSTRELPGEMGVCAPKPR